MKKVALIGMGNIMFNDEGVGVYCVEYIRKNYKISNNLTIIDGGTLGFKLMSFYQDYDLIIIVGTTSQNGNVGDIFINSGDEVIAQGKTRQSANEVEIAMMLEICSLSNIMGEVKTVGIIPKDIQTVYNGLSEEIQKKIELLTNTTIQLLKSYNIKLEKNNNIPFKEILDFYANPKSIF